MQPEERHSKSPVGSEAKWQWKTFPWIISVLSEMKGSVKEPNKFHNYETEKITRKASDTAEYIELFGSSTRDHHAQRI